MTSREKFEAFLVSEYEWGNDALNAANFHGDDATGYYTGGDFIYDGQSCSECLFWAWRGWQAAELASEQKLTDMAVQLANAESKCRELAAESDKTSERMQQLIQIINNADNDYCMCGDAMKNHTHGGCGYPTGMFDYHYNQWLQAENKTPATDAFLAEVRAQGVEMAACALDDVNQFNYANMLDDLAQKIRQEAAQ
ncbi:hypothetical protein [Citrobacter portucalensis]|uniref:hypothetical protein n=1 Tax=Citrobacter portucalensis TaxID=1639133 RepID=UPI00339D9DF5